MAKVNNFDYKYDTEIAVLHENRYKNITNGSVVLVDKKDVAGMCSKTIGMTFVSFRHENSDVLCVMEHKEFYNKHIKII